MLEIEKSKVSPFFLGLHLALFVLGLAIPVTSFAKYERELLAAVTAANKDEVEKYLGMGATVSDSLLAAAYKIDQRIYSRLLEAQESYSSHSVSADSAISYSEARPEDPTYHLKKKGRFFNTNVIFRGITDPSLLLALGKGAIRMPGDEFILSANMKDDLGRSIETSQYLAHQHCLEKGALLLNEFHLAELMKYPFDEILKIMPDMNTVQWTSGLLAAYPNLGYFFDPSKWATDLFLESSERTAPAFFRCVLVRPE